MATGNRRRKTDFKPGKLHLKTDLVSCSARVERLVKYTDEMLPPKLGEFTLSILESFSASRLTFDVWMILLTLLGLSVVEKNI